MEHAVPALLGPSRDRQPQCHRRAPPATLTPTARAVPSSTAGRCKPRKAPGSGRSSFTPAALQHATPRGRCNLTGSPPRSTGLQSRPQAPASCGRAHLRLRREYRTSQGPLPAALTPSPAGA
ncbi:hypothetical protein NDU88_004059 [Pleurodeles waltl]|uniref:Uncharacterized protein n=1 Tax=Pleurodeles waltl TaxID=8319 RepID=A0AAV7T829_PLEWA|nr:hypothetical protein NDU88_004059 [Pleurodeles waltl]